MSWTERRMTRVTGETRVTWILDGYDARLTARLEGGYTLQTGRAIGRSTRLLVADNLSEAKRIAVEVAERDAVTARAQMAEDAARVKVHVPPPSSYETDRPKARLNDVARVDRFPGSERPSWLCMDFAWVVLFAGFAIFAAVSALSAVTLPSLLAVAKFVGAALFVAAAAVAAWLEWQDEAAMDELAA